MKKGVISTSGLNSYGSRVMTEGIDLTQYKKNPVLLYMHNRGFDGKAMPIGKMTNISVEGDRLIGEPDFDMNDPFAKLVAEKWENGYLKMFSAGLEIVETTTEAQYLLAGQTRATVLKSKLTEVSIVDIGGNDEALQLTCAGKLLTLASEEECGVLPLVNAGNNRLNKDNNVNVNKKMNEQILLALGLAKEATNQQVLEAINLLKQKADNASALELAAITTLVDTAVAERKITEAKKSHFIELGKKVGVESLRETLSLMAPAMKPTDVINPQTATLTGSDKTLDLAKLTKLSEVPADEVETVKKNHPADYARLYKGEYGVELY